MTRPSIIVCLMLAAGLAAPGRNSEALPDVKPTTGPAKPSPAPPKREYRPLACTATSGDVGTSLTVLNKGPNDLAKGIGFKYVCAELSGKKKMTDSYKLEATLAVGQSIVITNLAPGLHACQCSLVTNGAPR
jgi:hypothetical protein